MTPQELGTKLKQARESVGMSQADVADALNLTRTAITQMENGKRAVSTLELSQLAALYHRPVSAFFGAHDADEEDVLAVLNRALPDFGARDVVKKQVSRYLNWCREGHNLERILGRGRRSVLPAYTPPVPKDSWQAVQQGEAIARQERKRLDLGRAPVPDMVRLMRTQGIWASAAAFPDGISGLFLSHTSIGMAIFANAAHSRSRKRFAYAHQYAHALMEREAPVTLSQAANLSELAEQRANAFATAFLLPADGVAALLESFGKGKQRVAYYDVAMLARHFGVSYLAAVYRLKNLHHISPTECATLAEKADMGKEYLRQLDYLSDLDGTDDESTIQRALRGDIIYLALEAHRREEISRGKLGDIAELLDVDKHWLTAQAIESRGGSSRMR